MKYKKGIKGLIIPKPTEKRSEDLNPGAIEAWRNELPINNLKESLQSCHTLLKRLHQTQMPSEERLQVLSLLRPTVSYLCSALDLYYKKNFLLNNQPIEIFNIMIALNLELYSAYKLVLNDIATLPNRKLSQFLEGIFLCLHQNCKIIFLSYDAYHKPPDLIWLEAHTLYAYAEELSLEDKPLNKELKIHSRFNTIADVYKHILLFVLTNPLRYHRSDMLKLYYSTETWAPYLSLIPNEKQQNILFKVDITKDMPPYYTALEPSQSGIFYYLKLDRLLERIDRLLAYQDNPQQNPKNKFQANELALPSYLLNMLLHIWQNFNQRRAVRRKSSGSKIVVVGLENIYEHISQKSSQATQTKSILNTDFEEIDLSAFPLPKDLSKFHSKEDQVIECTIVDNSDTGYCFKYDTNQCIALESGKIAALLHEEEGCPPHWQLALIRWVQKSNSNNALFGVEILSNHALPAEFELKTLNKTESFKGLLVQQTVEKARHLLLITPPLNISHDVELTILSPQKNKNEAHFQKKMSTFASFHCWEITFVKNTPHWISHTEKTLSSKTNPKDKG